MCAFISIQFKLSFSKFLLRSLITFQIFMTFPDVFFFCFCFLGSLLWSFTLNLLRLVSYKTCYSPCMAYIWATPSPDDSFPFLSGLAIQTSSFSFFSSGLSSKQRSEGQTCLDFLQSKLGTFLNTAFEEQCSNFTKTNNKILAWM